MSDTVTFPPPTLATAECHSVLFFSRIADRFGHAMRVATPAGGCRLDDLKALVARDIPGGLGALDEPDPSFNIITP